MRASTPVVIEFSFSPPYRLRSAKYGLRKLPTCGRTRRIFLVVVALAGYGVLKATAHAKLLNFASNIGGFAAFAFVGAVSWKIGLMMGVVQFLGARVGAG
jgi:hypothetical protein